MISAAELLLARSEDDAAALRFEDASWSWRQVVEQSRARAAMLGALRLRIGRPEPFLGRPEPFHVGVLLENVPEYLFLLGGAALAGATVVGVNPTRRGAELARDIRHTDCQIVFTDSSHSPLLEDLDIGAPTVMVDGGDYPGGPAGGPGGLAGGPPGDPGVADSSALELVPDPHTLFPPRPSTLYLLLFTSGSTGAPKAVKVTQGRLTEMATAIVSGTGFGPGDVLYCAMPMFHGNALITCVFPAIAAGATLVLRRRFSATGFLPDVRRYGVTYFNYVGRALAYILATPAAEDDRDNTLRMAFGTDASQADASAFRRRFGCPVVEGYGSSEGAISMSPVPGMPKGALGRPPPGVDVVVVDDAGVERPRARFDHEGRLANATEAIGEIVSRDGPGRFEGYYANPEAEAERTRRGWFWSGDLAYRDDDGYFYFAGRTSDWLRVDGENFAAAPVERILERLPEARVAVVYPVPDPRTGDQVMAALELDESAEFDPARFMAFLSDQPDLGTKWAPRLVRVTARVPLTASGKVDKRPLRDERWETSDPVWWWPPDSRRPLYRRLTGEDAERLRRDFAAHGRSDYLQH